MNGKSYALPIDLGTVSYGASKYNPQVVFTKNATATSARKIATNYDSTGRCMYYAEASNMQGFVALVGTLVADLVRTVGVTVMNTTTVFENQTVFEVSNETVSVNQTFSFNETVSVVFQCFTNCSYDTSLDSVCSEGPGAGLCVGDMEAKYLESSKCCRTEKVSRSCKTDKPYEQKLADACPNSCNCTDATKRAACLDNDQYCQVNVSSVDVAYNEVQSGVFSLGCLGTPLYLILLPIFCAPLALYLIGRAINEARVRAWQQNTDENEEGCEMDQPDDLDALPELQKAASRKQLEVKDERRQPALPNPISVPPPPCTLEPISPFRSIAPLHCYAAAVSLSEPGRPCERTPLGRPMLANGTKIERSKGRWRVPRAGPVFARSTIGRSSRCAPASLSE
jgi:hypothetical protein